MSEVKHTFSNGGLQVSTSVLGNSSSHEEVSVNRRKLESEDSSYDSDHESNSNSQLALHEHVSRTPSETLATEFAEYVSVIDNDLANLMRDPSYTSKVEFALRLGYTEDLLQRALLKLGVNAAQNQILEELIRLHKTSKPLNSNLVPDINEENKNLNASNENELLPIVIDGSNLAMSHGNKTRFSCKGILLAVQYFQNRGHRDIIVFVPAWRKEAPRPDTPITDQHVLLELEREGVLTFTPSRQVRGKRFVCHDDRYILNLAAETEGIVVSNDNYKDLINDKPEYKRIIEERILMYSFVNDRFMPPDDPLGRNGPTLSQFLRRPSSSTPACPYGRKCTYGNKCKFFHAERGHSALKSVTDQIKEQSTQRISEVRARTNSRDSSPGDLLTRTRSLQPLQRHSTESDSCGLKSFSAAEKMALCRTRSTAITSTQQYLLPQQVQQQDVHRQDQWLDVPDQQGLWLSVPLVPDTSQLPPPPPRSPWSESTAQLSSSHRKISRQLTLNPSFDPRLHSIPFPPPVAMPPPPHSAVTRNASAPPDPQENPQHNALHKTLSENSIAAPAPLIGSGIWETQDQSNVDHKTCRSKLYYHLAAVFPEEQVLRAMAAMPEETDPQRICALIISLNGQRANGI